RARHVGELFLGRLRELREKHACIGEVRGLGAMVSMELVKNRNASEPDADLTKALVQAVAKKGLVILPCGVRGNVIRYLAPLTIADELVNEGMDIIAEALAELSS